ncbi:MAG TPA: hypothetical protein PKH07_05535, partial [bacterium]|nr:hypothetical protein [bacterium]
WPYRPPARADSLEREVSEERPVVISKPKPYVEILRPYSWMLSTTLVLRSHHGGLDENTHWRIHSD